MSASQDAKNWFVLLRGKRYGPYTFAALVHAAERGVVDKDAGVWCLGWTEWRIARNVPGLFAPEPEPETEEEGRDDDEGDREDSDEHQADEFSGEDEPDQEQEDDRDDERELRATRDPREGRSEARRRGEADERSATRLRSEKRGRGEVDEPDEPGSRSEKRGRGEVAESAETRSRSEKRGRDTVDEPSETRLQREKRGRDDLDEPARSRREKRGRVEVDEPEEIRDRDEIDDGGKAGAGKPSPDVSPGGRPGSRLSDLSDLRAPSRNGDLRAPSRDAELRVGRDADLRTSGRDAEVRSRTRDADLRVLHRDDDLRSVGRDLDESEPDEKADDVPSDDISGGPSMSKPEAAVETRSTSLGARVRLVGLSVLGTLAIVLATAGAAAWLGYMRVEFMPAQTAAQAPAPAKSNPLLASTPAVTPPQTNAASTAAPARNMIDGVPDIVADLPAVAALKKVDPDAYAKFVKRFAATYKAGAADDEALTQARTALRKSIKPLLAKAATESLLEITEVNLAYMRALQPVNPGSCVALSDENKGAALDANLARDNAPLFQREMAVLERVINNAGSNEPAPTESEVKPYLQSVFDTLQKQQAQTALLSRGKLTTEEYGPYCNLVVAFYEAVRALPFADAVKLLRNLYAAAAAEPDTDTP